MSCTNRSARPTSGSASTSTCGSACRPASSAPRDGSGKWTPMGADISRVRFDPLAEFSGVVLQQGRLLLVADFNEYVAMLDSRLRAESCALTAPAVDATHQGVAWVPRLTPQAFRVTAAAGKLTIGRARMYVDGLVAENHGNGPSAFDHVLAEQAGTED